MGGPTYAICDIFGRNPHEAWCRVVPVKTDSTDTAGYKRVLIQFPVVAEKFVKRPVERLARLGAVAGIATAPTGSHVVLVAHDAQQCRIFHCRVGHGYDLVEIEWVEMDGEEEVERVPTRQK